MAAQEGMPASAAPDRSSVTAPGVLLIVLGSITVLANAYALAVLAAGGDLGIFTTGTGFEEVGGSQLLLGLTAYFVAMGATAVVAGIGVLRRVQAWRIVGLAMAIIAAAAQVANLLGNALAIILLVPWVLTISLLLRDGDAFGRAGAEPSPVAGPVLATIGLAILPVSWFVPVIADSALINPEAPLGVWLWSFFLEPFSVFVVVVVVTIRILLRGPGRFAGGILIGGGIALGLLFIGYVGLGTTLAPFGPGSAVSLAAAALVVAGGALVARASPPSGEGTLSPAAPLLGLGGAVLLILPWFLPIFSGGGGLLATGRPIYEWIWVFQQSLGTVLVATASALWALGSAERSLPGGVLLGLGIHELAAYIVLFGVAGANPPAAVGMGTFVGIVGAALLVVAGVACAPRGARVAPSPATP